MSPVYSYMNAELGGETVGAPARAGACSRRALPCSSTPASPNAEPETKARRRQRQPSGSNRDPARQQRSRLRCGLREPGAAASRRAPDRSTVHVFHRPTRTIRRADGAPRVPTIYPHREFADAGGLMSYGTSVTDIIARSASMPAASSRARSRPTCRSCSRPSSSWSSTSRRRRRSASTCRRRCSPAPTR